ncbi:hypothetical protein TNCV_4169821 [Trichonephila clavipes]|nr:hypothetical protein TNCV_4169821 [Trichonephila clavipes]
MPCCFKSMPPTLHQLLLFGGGRANLSSPHGQMLSIDNRFEDTMQVRSTFEYPVYRGSSKHDVVLHYLVGRWRLADLKDRALTLSVICCKCADLHSNYRRSELEMCVPCTQWLAKSSQKAQGPYAEIESKQAMSCLFGASRYVNGHQNTAGDCNAGISGYRIPVF